MVRESIQRPPGPARGSARQAVDHDPARPPTDADGVVAGWPARRAAAIGHPAGRGGAGRAVAARALIAIAPVTGPVRSGLHIGSATAGLFTSIPVLLFALAAPPALILLARAGLDRVMLFALLGIGLGTLIRSSGGLAIALTGTVLLGLAVGVGNVAAPVAVGRDFPRRSGPVTGVYTASLNVGSMLSSLLTAPLADVVGWRWALASWSAMGFIAAAVWWIVGRGMRPLATTAEDEAADVSTGGTSASHGFVDRATAGDRRRAGRAHHRRGARGLARTYPGDRGLSVNAGVAASPGAPRRPVPGRAGRGDGWSARPVRDRPRTSRPRSPSTSSRPARSW